MKESFLKPLGFFFLALALLGFVLPILPGTPFLLLSAWFFARSSEKWHAWLLNSKLFGPIILNWETHHCINLRTKYVAIISMLGAGGASVFFAVDDIRLKLAGGILMMIGTSVILMIKTCPSPKSHSTDCQS
tara:strand:+ start:537 stop:932 length:396 start_codon:yes stop_codon:yes gene_type:complete